MNSSNHNRARWMAAVITVGVTFASGIPAASEAPSLPKSCLTGVELARQGDHVSAILAWKTRASDLSLKAAAIKVLQCLPIVLYSDDHDKIALWLREAAKSGDAEAEAIAGVFFLSSNSIEASIVEGLSLLERAATKGHDGARFALFVYELEFKTNRDAN